MKSINIEEMAKKMGLEAPYTWEPQHMLPVYKLVAKESAGEDKIIISGRGPAFLYVLIAHAAHPAAIGVVDPKVAGGPIMIPPLTIGDGGSKIIEENDYIVVDINPNMDVLDYRDLEKIKIPDPEMGSGKGIILNGRAPIWLYVAVGLAYSHIVPWVAVAQGKNGVGIVVISHDPSVKLGTTIKIGGQ